ncbi:hypothetical protein MRB53_030690 [Persea americana]|uniref:Uncharacterized protein n=1 Tax=Persea americana TaxID=3435 RepID=A0ACC2KMA4_PERAE|nr:hypothetical protein MRB53_030690 [Persea americana]
MQEELQQGQTEVANEIPPSIPSVNSLFVPSSNPAIIHSKAESIGSISPANVKPKAFVDKDIRPPSPRHIVQMVMEGTVSLVVSSPTLVVPERIEEGPVPVESVPIPIEGDETIQLPSTELRDTLLQAETIDPFINKDVVSIEERPIAVDSGETILEPPVQFSEVQDQLPLESTSQFEAEGYPRALIGTHSMLPDLERQYEFQQQKFEDQSSRMQACQYSFLITEKELRDFEAMLDEC